MNKEDPQTVEILARLDDLDGRVNKLVAQRVLSRLTGKEDLWAVTIGDSHIKITEGEFVRAIHPRPNGKQVFYTAQDTSSGKIQFMIDDTPGKITISIKNKTTGRIGVVAADDRSLGFVLQAGAIGHFNTDQIFFRVQG